MKVFMYLEDFEEYCKSDTCVVLGNFDGVHKGHQELIRCCVNTAKERGLTPVLFTFINHPSNEIAGKTVVKNIMTREEKTYAAEALGIEYMVTAIFNREMMTCDPELFISELMCKKLHMKFAVCGFNYTFGYRAKGNVELLKELSLKYGYDYKVIDEIKIDGNTVSSTFIRKIISDGRLDEYEKYTGRNYSITGKVLEGQKLGRTIGFPTINLNLFEEWALPLNGVYITKTYVNNAVYCSITNVGNKPSVGTFDKNAETHIFNFNEDIYGKTVKVEFLKMLREERRFASIQELSMQISMDCENARNYHGLD